MTSSAFHRVLCSTNIYIEIIYRNSEVMGPNSLCTNFKIYKNSLKKRIIFIHVHIQLYVMKVLSHFVTVLVSVILFW